MKLCVRPLRALPPLRVLRFGVYPPWRVPSVLNLSSPFPIRFRTEAASVAQPLLAALCPRDLPESF